MNVHFARSNGSHPTQHIIQIGTYAKDVFCTEAVFVDCCYIYWLIR